jgi:carbon monoxide dehydrogenase subunit G
MVFSIVRAAILRGSQELAPQDDDPFVSKEIPMASLHKDIPINAHPDQVWAAVRDFGAVARLAPGFVVDTKLEDGARIVTFANGSVAREVLVDCDEARQRLVYAIVSERVTHYNASVQVLDDGEARSRLIWIVDVLPNDIAPYISGQMDLGVQAMQQALGRVAS